EAGGLRYGVAFQVQRDGQPTIALRAQEAIPYSGAQFAKRRAALRITLSARLETGLLICGLTVPFQRDLLSPLAPADLVHQRAVRCSVEIERREWAFSLSSSLKCHDFDQRSLSNVVRVIPEPGRTLPADRPRHHRGKCGPPRLGWR